MRWILLGILVVITGLLRLSAHHLYSISGAETVLALGFILLFSFLLGKVAAGFRLPMITGYLLGGVIAGPEVAGLVSAQATEKLHLIDQIALGIIALTAGGELRLPVLKQQLRSILSVVSFQIVLVFFGVSAGILLLSGVLGLDSHYSSRELVVVAVLLATVAIAKSPATTIAVITESRAAGPVTDRAIGITVLKDVVILILFTAVLALTQIFLKPGGVSLHADLLKLFGEMMLSIVAGLLIGLGIVGFLKYVRQDTAVFILGVAFLVSFLAEVSHLEGIMVCVIAGFVVENFSPYGDKLIQSIEESSLPIYVIFFSIAGASLNLSILKDFWLIASLLVILRLVTTYAGTVLGSVLARDPVVVKRYLWTGFLGQAGISLGLAMILGRVFADSFGPFVKTVIVATVVINQIIGPVLFRLGLEKAGEIGKKPLRRHGS